MRPTVRRHVERLVERVLYTPLDLAIRFATSRGHGRSGDTVPAASPAEASAPDTVVPPGDDAPDPSELALPDYEQLPASHVVAKLSGLTQGERDLIERFESARRNRRTVLGKLEQLRETR